jgi:hypothetical protein
MVHTITTVLSRNIPSTFLFEREFPHTVHLFYVEVTGDVYRGDSDYCISVAWNMLQGSSFVQRIVFWRLTYIEQCVHKLQHKKNRHPMLLWQHRCKVKFIVWCGITSSLMKQAGFVAQTWFSVPDITGNYRKTFCYLMQKRPKGITNIHISICSLYFLFPTADLTENTRWHYEI